MSQAIHSYIDDNKERFQAELFDFLRIPSVSARTEHNQDVAAAAEWVAQRARDLGMSVALHKTKGHPIVVARHEKAGSNAPTVLIYGHYDVQPVEPLELWETKPFEPV